MGYFYLAIAIIGELIGTTLLKMSQGFSKWGIGIVALIAYVICFYFFSKSLKIIDLGVAYAIWSGVGIVITTIIGIIIWKEKVNLITIIGELIGTTLLKMSQGFSKWGIGIVALIAYVICFYFFSKSLKIIDLGVAYAIWSGVGIVITTIIGIIIWKEKVNLITILAITMIIIGIMLLNLMSASN